MTNNPLNHSESLDNNEPPDIPGFIADLSTKFGDALAPTPEEWTRIQAANAALKRYARTDMFKVRLGDLNELIDQADLEAEGHGMSKDLSKLVDEMSEVIGELKAIIAS